MFKRSASKRSGSRHVNLTAPEAQVARTKVELVEQDKEQAATVRC